MTEVALSSYLVAQGDPARMFFPVSAAQWGQFTTIAIVVGVLSYLCARERPGARRDPDKIRIDRQRERTIAHQDFQEEAMDDMERSTGKPAVKGDVGPFTNNEIWTATKNAVKALGLNYDEMTGVQRDAFLEQAIGALTGTKTTHFADLPRGTTPGIEVSFRKLVLQELQNSPKWDLDEFNAGYGKGRTGTGGREHGRVAEL